jgi:arylsulfatase A-like enzyme
VSDALSSQIDLPSTVLDMVGITYQFSRSAGTSFLSSLHGEELERNEVFFEQEESRGVRTDQFSYWCRLPGAGPNVLFDHNSDPLQTKNVADQPEYSDVVEELHLKVTDFFSQYSDNKYDIWNAGQAKGSISSETFLAPLMPEGWTATTTSIT